MKLHSIIILLAVVLTSLTLTSQAHAQSPDLLQGPHLLAPQVRAGSHQVKPGDDVTVPIYLEFPMQVSGTPHNRLNVSNLNIVITYDIKVLTPELLRSHQQIPRGCRVPTFRNSNRISRIR